MAYRVNPFLERRSERGTTDQEFVRLFSPRIFERLKEQDPFAPGLHLFRSAPGGGKTTILRCFTPNVLRSFWQNRTSQPESYRYFAERGVVDEADGPRILGVLLSCAAGYADLPPGASTVNDGLFRALLDCRVVLRTLRGVMDLAGQGAEISIDEIELSYDEQIGETLSIPSMRCADELATWAESREREIFDRMESAPANSATLSDVRFHAMLWLQAVEFHHKGRRLELQRLLMIDDIHKLRRHQRDILVDELTTLRPTIPVWLAARSIAFADEFLSQGSRLGRDIESYSLDDVWGNPAQFALFAGNVVERRFDQQTELPRGEFTSYLSDQFEPGDLTDAFTQSLSTFNTRTKDLRGHLRYAHWISSANRPVGTPRLEDVLSVISTRILIARDVANRQMSFELVPLSTEDLEGRESSALRGAAEIFARHELGIAYYYGLERLYVMATGNVEELLTLAAALYDGIKAKQTVRRSQHPALDPKEQEKRLLDAVDRRAEFIPSSHTEGRRALRLLDSIAAHCRERTFLPNAPYAPGVTGVRLSNSEKRRLDGGTGTQLREQLRLKRVLAECVAENLLVTRDSASSSSREAGTVFYLNRGLCARYGLPLQYGGWQDVTINRLTEWIERGFQPSKALELDV